MGRLGDWEMRRSGEKRENGKKHQRCEIFVGKREIKNERRNRKFKQEGNATCAAIQMLKKEILC